MRSGRQSFFRRDAVTKQLSPTHSVVRRHRSKDEGDLSARRRFAAETNDVVGYARSKMEKKGLDIVVANDVTKDGAGFNTDTNIATILTRLGGETSLPLMSKRELADKILDEIVNLRKAVPVNAAKSGTN